MKNEQYVDQRDGGYYLAGSRIGLDSVVYPFKQGASPESILQSFPTAGSLEGIYGAITFYLANKDVVEVYLADQERLMDELSRNQPPLPGSLVDRLRKARHEMVPR
ncbi:MAG: hypothetical protein ABIR70_17485 [Bryobacteraceae bacterium]